MVGTASNAKIPQIGNAGAPTSPMPRAHTEGEIVEVINHVILRRHVTLKRSAADTIIQ